MGGRRGNDCLQISVREYLLRLMAGVTSAGVKLERGGTLIMSKLMAGVANMRKRTICLPMNCATTTAGITFPKNFSTF